MKKITLFLAAAAVLASCNREEALTSAQGGNSGNLFVKNYEASELQGMITPMAQSFGFSGKAAGVQANYTYRGWAEPVQLNLTASGIPGTENLVGAAAVMDLSASAAWTVNDIVFVVWHAAEVAGQNSSSHNVNGSGPKVGGSITAYKQVGIGQYEFKDRVDFFDADYHEVYGDVNAGSGNYEIMMAGQRATATSGYLLSGHDGAVVTRIDYDYINDEFWEGSFREIPLPGRSANDIVGAARRFYVVTGDAFGAGNGNGVYELDRNLININKGESLTAGHSGRSIAIDNNEKLPGSENTDHMFVLATNGGQIDFRQQYVSWIPGISATNFTLGAPTFFGGGINTNNLERADLTIATSTDDPFRDPNLMPVPTRINWSPERTFMTLHSTIAGAQSVFNLLSTPTPGVYNLGVVPNIGNALSTEYDPALDVLYVAMGGDVNGKAVKVIALDRFAGQSPIINTYDVVGEFADPAIGVKTLSNGSQMTPTINDVKEITIYGSRNIAVAAGSQGVYFIQRDKF
jgi:hypothetical protein